MAKEWVNIDQPTKRVHLKAFCVLVVFDEDIVMDCRNCVVTFCMSVSTISAHVEKSIITRYGKLNMFLRRILSVCIIWRERSGGL